jgi:hypothetical protein
MLSSFLFKMTSMMTTTTATPLHPAPLSEILTGEEQASLSEDIQQKLNESINEVKKSFHNAKMQLQQEKVSYGKSLLYY